MGSFGHSGNFSNLPINCSDKVVMLVGVRNVCVTHNNEMFAPGESFTPITLPIRGEYNDYGGIENVVRTPGIEKLEKFFGLTVEEIVEVAERWECECYNDIKSSAKKIIKKLHSFDKKTNYIGYVMEHESVFDKLVSMTNCAIKDKRYNSIPNQYLIDLGYQCEVIEKDENERDVCLWKHDTLPTLKYDFYVWLEKDYEDYNKTNHTISELCHRIGCEVPKKFEQSYLESMFLSDCEFIKNYYAIMNDDSYDEDDEDSVCKKMETMLDYKYKYNHDMHEDFTFVKASERYGLFRWSESTLDETNLCCIFDIYNNEHLLDSEHMYMKEFVELAAFIQGLVRLDLSWGATSCTSQDMRIDEHIDFLNTCLKTANDIKSKWQL